jgi:diacylglycerol kinase (ATP)
MIRKYEIILNPEAGKGNGIKTVPIIREFMESHTLTYRMHLTERPGHAIDIAAGLCLDPETAVIAAGGDGTCNEVVNGLMAGCKSRQPTADREQAQSIPLFGVLPIGRGNDFSFGADLPQSLQESLELFLAPKVRPFDIGLTAGGDYPEGRYFVNGIGVGFDTIVGLEAAKMRHIHGAAGYALGALKTLIVYPPPPTLEISYNSKSVTENPVLVSIMNGRRMGGAFYMAPNSIQDDGLLNICMTRHGRRGVLLKTMLHYTRGTQDTLSNTITDTTKAISLKCIKGGMAVHADGETICTSGKELTVSCVRHAILLLGKTGETV